MNKPSLRNERNWSTAHACASGVRLVNMSSVMGRKAIARFGSYGLVMHAMSGFSDALRQELAGTKINVSVIYPALTATTR